jgi:hypothetical protein
MPLTAVRSPPKVIFKPSLDGSTFKCLSTMLIASSASACEHGERTVSTPKGTQEVAPSTYFLLGFIACDSRALVDHLEAGRLEELNVTIRVGRDCADDRRYLVDNKVLPKEDQFPKCACFPQK